MADFQSDRFREEPVLGILRHVTESALSGVMETAIACELRHIEITLNTAGALRLIEKSRKLYDGLLCVGAGTVLSRQDAADAQSAGAQFLVAPTFNEDTASFCRERRIPFFPGAFTPTEIERAWNAGAAMVKVFPARQLGAKFFGEMKGPFPDIQLMAVGGIGPANVAEYLQNGADALAFGGSIFSPERMKNAEFAAIRKDLEEFLFAVRGFFSRI
jgi:2-dehydro-3-deoxyphosphogluconate aldolase/(4S)-4-hydroxy-2-oxoglutarate aldolase